MTQRIAVLGIKKARALLREVMVKVPLGVDWDHLSDVT